jgi:hypothetical protein
LADLETWVICKIDVYGVERVYTKGQESGENCAGAQGGVCGIQKFVDLEMGLKNSNEYQEVRRG